MNRLGIVTPLLVLTLFGCAAPIAPVQPAAPATTAQPRATVSRPTTAPTTEAPEPATYVPTKADFEVKLKILEKKCFGSAGCNLRYRIKPTYAGPEDLPDDKVEVTYTVTGGEDGPVDNTFTVENGSVNFNSEEQISTSSSSKKLKVKVSDVEVLGF